jgi:CBS domain-containing protein
MDKKLKFILEEKDGGLITADQDLTLFEAVGMLVKNKIGSLMVLDDKGEVAGIFTERDVLKKLASTEDCIGALLVKEVMTPKDNLIVGHADDTVEYLMEIMTENSIRHIPLLGDDGKLLSVISIRDLVKAQLRDNKNKVKYLSDYISGSYPS